MKRRQFLKGLTYGVAGLSAASLTSIAKPYNETRTLIPLATGRKRAIQPIGTARNLIFIFLDGGTSHVDTFDLKLGRQTPQSLGNRNLGHMLWPDGIMPKLANLSDKFSVVRSLTAVEAVHERAAYHLTTGYRQDASRMAEIPHILSAISYELSGQRTAQQTVPSALFFGRTVAEEGFFPIENRGLKLGFNGSIENMSHDIQDSHNRFGLLDSLRSQQQSRSASDERSVHATFQGQARRMMLDTELHALFGINTNDDDDFYDFNIANNFLSQCQTAVRVLEANKGTRAIQIGLGDWDHHFGIYDGGDYSLAAMAQALDTGLAYLIENLESKPAASGSGTLLDETLIVAAGEFGRTTGNLNESGGRDHYPYAMSALFAGGGVKGGRAIGSTSDDGSYVVDRGWSHNRTMGISDLQATLYAALGIDYTKRYTDTPSGRLFELVSSRGGDAHTIDALFS